MFNRRVIILIAVLMAVLISAFIFLCIYFSGTEKQIYRSYVNKLNDEYNFTLDIYTNTADLLLQNDIDIPEVKRIFRDAQSSISIEERNYYRNLLFDELSGFYSNISGYDFRQLHFHEPDNTSFLRFHKPEKYGDNLTGVRLSVEYVNRERERISGFEEGRIFNGYRNVYPLYLDEEYLGSVELSISMGAVLHQLQRRTQQNAQFIIRKTIVYKKVFEDQLDNYIDWKIMNDYMLDLSIAEDCVLENVLTHKGVEAIKKEIIKSEESGEGFAVRVDFDNEKKILAFIPILNFNEEIAGFVFSMTDDSKIAANKTYYRIVSVIFAGLLVFFIFFLVYYMFTDRKIKNMVIYDSLTRIYSRRMIFARLEEELQRYQRYKNPFCICMVDVDRFKRINDNYGHLAGDSLLSELSALIKENIRITDSIGRYGGDELMIIFPECDKERANIVMTHIRQKIMDRKFKGVGSITISGGIAMSYEGLVNCDELIEKADGNLYTAKELGRNRIVF